MFIVVALLGGLAGAVGLSVLTALLSQRSNPNRSATQFAIGFAFTIPRGMMPGSVTSVAVRQSRPRRGRRTRAGWIATSGGDAILAFASVAAGGSAFSGDGGRSRDLGVRLIIR